MLRHESQRSIANFALVCCAELLQKAGAQQVPIRARFRSREHVATVLISLSGQLTTLFLSLLGVATRLSGVHCIFVARTLSPKNC